MRGGLFHELIDFNDGRSRYNMTLLRPAFLALLCLGATPALAEDARVTFLSKQLSNAKDARVRAQTVLLLGQTNSPDAVPPLCTVMKDPESVVRAAAANALGEIHNDAALACLKSAQGETDATVRAAIEKALAPRAVTPQVAQGGLYLHVEPVQDKVGNLPENILQLADKMMREKLSAMGAAFAPAGEDKKAATALIKSKNLKGYQLRLQVQPGSSEKSLGVEMLIMTYPDQSLKGSWKVKGAGAKPESLIKALVPKVVDDVATELEWKN